MYPTSVGSYRLTLGYEYQNGLLKRIRDGGTGGTEVFWELTATDAVGRILNESLGNGVITYTEYDQAAGYMRLRQAWVGGGTGLIDATAQWDLNYNLSQRQDLKQCATETFVYDGLNRLDYSTLTTPGTGTITNQDLSYNAIGNILWKQDVGNYSYHASKKRAVIQAGTTSYGYDANGNMTSRGGSTIGYTSYNLPGVIYAGSNSSTLSYGAYRNRYKQVAVTAGISETTIYVGGILEKVTKSGTTNWRHRIEGPGGLLAIVNCTGSSCDPTASTNYVHRDTLGSPDLITNSAGTEVVKLSFGAFGERRDRDWHGAVSSADMTAIGNSTRRGFTEHEHLDAVGLIHMNGRVYDPVLGRFLASDPVADGLGRAGGFNRYAYVGNNPLTLIDPTGRSSRATRLPQHDSGTHGSLIEGSWVTGSGPDRETTVAALGEVTVTATSLAQSFTLGGSLAWSIATGATLGLSYAFVPNLAGGGGRGGGGGGSGGGGGGSDTPGSCDKPTPDDSPAEEPKSAAKAQCLIDCRRGLEPAVQGAAGAAGGGIAGLVLGGPKAGIAGATIGGVAGTLSGAGMPGAVTVPYAGVAGATADMIVGGSGGMSNPFSRGGWAASLVGAAASSAPADARAQVTIGAGAGAYVDGIAAARAAGFSYMGSNLGRRTALAMALAGVFSYVTYTAADSAATSFCEGFCGQ